MNTELLEKIKKLFALASSENQNEAELAARRANEMLLKHNLTMQDVENCNLEYLEKDVESFQRMPTEYKFVLPILEKYYRVKPVLVQVYNRQFKLRLIGEKTNVEVAQYTVAFLCRAFRETFHAANLETKQKQAFYHGMAKGIMQQLEQAKESVRQETGLVLVDDAKLKEMIARKRLKTHQCAGFNRDAAAQDQGFSAGQSLAMNKGINKNATTLIRGAK